MHKKRSINMIIVLAATLIMVLSFSVLSVSAVSVNNATAKVNASGGAYLRKSTSTGSKSICLLKNNSSVTIEKIIFKKKSSTSAKNKWYLVKSGSKEGYLRADLVDGRKYTSIRGTATAKINYRAGAGTGMALKGSIKKGTAVEVLLKAKPLSAYNGSSSTWYMIKVGGSKYYACSSSIKLTEETTTDTEPEKKEPGESTTAEITAKAQINSSDGVIVRKSASTSSAKVTSLANNASITILKEKYTDKTATGAKKIWYYIKTGSKKGYVRSDLVDNIKYSPVSAVMTDNANFRVGPGTSMNNEGAIAKSDKINVYLEAEPASGTEGSSKIWYKIKHNSKYRYVCSKYVRITAGETDPTESVPEETKPEEKPGEPTFTLSGVTYPEKLTVGASFSLKGTVSCAQKIMKVKIGVIDSEGDWMAYVNKNVEKTSFDISAVDSEIRFGRLTPGDYTYVGDFTVGDKTYRKINCKFTVKEIEKTLTDEIVAKRIDELVTGLSGKYFTSDSKACTSSTGATCNVVNVIRDNATVKNLVKKNKSEGTIDSSLFPCHYNPSGVVLMKGWSCCGFAGFAGWYIAADDINSNVNYVMVKTGCNYNYSNMKTYAKPGDIIRSAGHSFVVIEVQASGCKVIDSNWGHDCKVTVHNIPYTYCDVVTVNRATIRS